MRDVVFIKLSLLFVTRAKSNGVMDTAIYRVAITKRCIGGITFNQDSM